MLRTAIFLLAAVVGSQPWNDGGPLQARGTTMPHPSVPELPSRAVVNLDSGWEYLADRSRTLHELERVPPSAWTPVSLPHTWNQYDATDVRPEYRRDASWYRRSLSLADYPPGTRFILRFEDANTVADVYVNGTRAGGHVGGYIGFDIDVTPEIRRGGVNDVLVRVDNSDDGELIPSDKSDFVIYGGLTRDVWLVVEPAVAIHRIAVRTPAVSRAVAQTQLAVELRNPSLAHGALALEATLADPDGRIVVRTTTRAALDGDTSQTVSVAMPPLRSPRLWSPSSPSLYTIAVTLRRANGSVDRLEDRAGYRWFRFEPHGPFYLNGERLLLRGTQRHEEAAGYGAALPNPIHRSDMAQIKAMGANFVRLAHYPQDPEVYRAADSLGLLLWDELPWCRAGVGDSLWRSNTRRLLREQIAQNLNHPSIIMWSLGNEVADVVEPTKSGDTATLRGFMSELAAIAHALDPGRPTATRKFNAGADIVDVYSPSIWAGWYGGVYRDYEKALIDARSRWPRFVHMEYGADAQFGRHNEAPITGEGLKLEPDVAEQVGKPVKNVAREGDWSESYQTDLLDWHLMVSERLPWLTGTAQWIFRDFATPLRPENPIPYVNEKGLLTRDGIPKDSYYVFKSYWTDSPRFAYIVSHTWTERSGPKGQTRQVRVYSNCAAVELKLNGATLGVRQRDRNDFPGQGLRWDVAFREGSNSLRAACAGASAEERGVGDSLVVHYTSNVAGAPGRIVLSTQTLPNRHLLVQATLVDGDGRRSLNARNRIYFSREGAGELVADRGTPTGSRVIEAADGRASIELVPAPAGERSIVLARTQGIDGTRVVIGGSAVGRASTDDPGPADDPAPANDPAPAHDPSGDVAPRTILLRGENLLETRRRLQAGDTRLRPAYSALIAQANAALSAGPFTVTSKATFPPSGDKHDYASLAPYWWPDSRKSGGLPYVRHDGRVNPESRVDNDGGRFGRMAGAVDALALSYYFSGEPRYAERAALLLRVWFLDPATRMNPNLRYAQAVRGINDGRSIGIVSTRGLAHVVDAVRLIGGSPAWTGADRKDFTQWCRSFLQWLLTSNNGRDERAARNNHGSWYDVQTAALALFVGDTVVARDVLRGSIKRLAIQITGDGREPLELARTRSLSYSFFNLEALEEVAEMGRLAGIDVWHSTAPSGGSILSALRFLAPYAVPGARWPGQQITPVDPTEFLLALRRAATVYQDTAITRAIDAMPESIARSHRSALLYPSLGTASASSPASSDTLADRVLRFAQVQLRRAADSLDPRNGYPRATRADGSWSLSRPEEWTSGFFAGELWYMYQLTSDPYWRAQAERWTAGLEANKLRTNTHDLGFLIFDSFGHEYRLTHDAHARDVILTAAASLARRFNPTVGAIKSWDTEHAHDRRATWRYPVIVDNLMNLDLLFWASAHGGDPSWHRIAEQHALTSARAHVRPDGSTAHVALFDPATGALTARVTWQGYSDSSVWARGQAWAIYGFTDAYHATRRPELLQTAERTADWFIAHLPTDGVPYWDFRDPAIPNVERDASAGAIAASGLLALSHETSGDLSNKYRAAADHILTTLCTSYLTTGTSGASILRHAVGGRPQNSEVDVGIVYADYYLIEALLRRREGW